MSLALIEPEISNATTAETPVSSTFFAPWSITGLAKAISIRSRAISIILFRATKGKESSPTLRRSKTSLLKS